VELILEVISPQAASMGSGARQAFGTAGGTIGREQGNSWVLPHGKVSARHARITYAGGTFYIEDKSRNGVCLNSQQNRIPPGEPQPLSSGDRLFIDPYQIRVSIEAADARGAGWAAPGDADPFADLIGDPSVGDPFAPPAERARPFDSPDQMSREELDPLALLNLHGDRPQPRTPPPSARDLDAGSPLDAHFRPPAVVPDSRPAPAPVDPLSIPQGYNPLLDEGPPPPVAPPRPAPPPRPPVVDRAPQPPPPIERMPAAPVERMPPPPDRIPQPVDPEPQPMRPKIGRPPARPEPARVEPDLAAAPARPRSSGGGDLAGVLEGAGLDPADVTPELAHAFGEIIRVVVSGVMDVLQSRRQIKDEFRMRMTQFRPAENNPLKFSANVEDALHNLLVKRNAAYLGPVDAFQDAFAELRNHQLAMLAGMRVAFESMLAEFDPDKLQEEFDRQASKGLVPAKMRYWDAFREKTRELAKDPEATFRQLFGEAFARAYEEQLKQLKNRPPES
jgi:type VI secretion system FHA domain protein